MLAVQTHPVASKAQTRVLSLQSSDVLDVLGQTEETENNPHQADGLHLHVAQAGEVGPQPGGPGVLPGQQTVRQQVLRLRLHLLQSEEDKVRAETVQQAGEVQAVRELDGHVPGDQLEAE